MNERRYLPSACHFFLYEILLFSLAPHFPLSFVLSGLSGITSKFGTWSGSHFITVFLCRTKAFSVTVVKWNKYNNGVKEIQRGNFSF